MLQECLLELGFVPSLAEASIYMSKCPKGEHYEYVATNLDNLAIILKDPQSLINHLKTALYNFKLKGSGPLNFYLGCGFHQDTTGTLCMDPGKYIDPMLESYKQYFGVKPDMKHRSPLQKGDHADIYTTPFLDEEGKMIYQSLIGCCHWNISIGKFDIHTAFMLMSRYHNTHRERTPVENQMDIWIAT